MQGKYKLGVSGSEVPLSGNDCELDVAHELICREARMADGSLKRDIIAIKRTWSFRYSYLPGKKWHVHDGGMGRDELRALWNNPLVWYVGHSLVVPTEDGAAESVAVQFVLSSWKEKIIQREGPLGTVYALSFALVEM